MCMFKNRQRLFQQPWDIWGPKRFPGSWGVQLHTAQTPHHFWLCIKEGTVRDSKW